MSQYEEITARFIKAWSDMDVDAILDFFTEDAEYANIPMGPPNRGKAEIRAFIEGFLGSTSEIEFIVHHQVENNGILMNERTDRICMNDKWVELPVMGVFEFEGDKIKAWRDYFDMGPFSSQ